MDSLLIKVGECGLYQRASSVLFSVFVFIPALNTMSPVFLAAKRDFWCVDQNSSSLNNSGLILVNNCKNNCKLEFNTSMFQSTIISQFDLTCDRQFLVPLATFTYVVGYLVGCPICGSLSDHIGRLKTVMITSLFVGPLNILSAFSNMYPVYVVARFLIGIACSSYLSVGATFIAEINTPRHRDRAMMNVFGNGFPAGCMFLVLLAYLIRNHVYLTITIGVFSLMPLIFYPFLMESPRWLIARGRLDEAFYVVNKMAEINSKWRMCPSIKINFNRDIFDELLNTRCDKNEAADLVEKSQDSVSDSSPFYHLITKGGVMLCLVILICYNFLTLSCIYIGFGLGSENVGGSTNIFITLLAMSILEVVAHFIASVTITQIGLTPVIIVTYFLGGLCVAIAVPFYRAPNGEIPLIVLTVLGRFFVTIAFTCQFTLSSALFPTHISNGVLGVGMAVSRLGNILGVFLFSLDQVWKPMPLFLPACLTLIGAFTNGLMLPEVYQNSIPKTMENATIQAKRRWCNKFLNQKVTISKKLTI